MASLRQIRRRMKSVENIHEITAAMEMIAAFRFKRAEGRFTRSRNYLRDLESIVANLSSAAGENFAHPLFERRPVQRRTLVFLTGDKGLCGAYNANLVKAAAVWMKNAGEADLLPVGKVGYEFFRKRRAPFLAQQPEKGTADLQSAQSLAGTIRRAFLEGRTDSVEILYTSYRPGGAGRSQVVPFLPLTHLSERKDGGARVPEYLYEPDFSGLFAELVSRYLSGKMHLLLLESLASELSARKVAMKQATENGEEVLDGLKLLRNKTRQATITRELSEIVGGASVLV